MNSILPHIWTWSWYSEEKGMNFNGHYIENGTYGILIDPPIVSTGDLDFFRQKGVSGIILTNRDHIRESPVLQEIFEAKIWVPEADSGEMNGIRIDRRFQDGEILPCGLKVISLADCKSPGESALYLEQSGGILILGDALIGKPEGKLRLLPSEKYADLEKARKGLRRLLDLPYDIVLVGDGNSLYESGKKAVELALK